MSFTHEKVGAKTQSPTPLEKVWIKWPL